MTLLATALERLSKIHAVVEEKALEMAKTLLTPSGPLPRTTVQHLLRRALRNGAWRALTQNQRALLIAAAQAIVKTYRSPLLLEQLRSIWLAVELATARGKAVVAALTHLLAKGATQLREHLRRSIDSLIALGLQVLNNPQLPTPST